MSPLYLRWAGNHMASKLPHSLVPALPRPRTLIHPGPANPARIHSIRATGSRHFRLLLNPGLSLFDALVIPLIEFGVRNASATILGGYFSTLKYCVAPADPSGNAVVAYSDPISAGRAYFIFGNATVGVDEQDAPIVHCHAALRTEDGTVKGGHILSKSCVVGRDPIAVLVTALDGVELRVTYDPETNISLIQPRKGPSHE
jgi:hypothetical protein